MVKKLFLSHYSGDAAEVGNLALALKLRGIVPWVDKNGGYQVADDSETEARRAIREDCFGLALWASRKAFTRDFIRDVEIDEARQMLENSSDFLLFAIPRAISFLALRESSETNFGIDLSRFHTVPVKSATRLHPTVEIIARQVMGRRLKTVAHGAARGDVSFQIATRDRLPPEQDDLLVVDACELFEEGVARPEAWVEVLDGLRDIKGEISTSFGRPRIRIDGSKHLSAAFLAGRVFSPFELAIRQTPTEIWHSDFPQAEPNPFAVKRQESCGSSRTLVVEIASGHKNIKAGVDGIPNSPARSCAIRLSLFPKEPLVVDNARCTAMARQAYEQIELAATRAAVSQIHLFAAAPGSFMAFLGRHFSGMPEAVTYEWEGDRYVQAATVPGSVL